DCRRRRSRRFRRRVLLRPGLADPPRWGVVVAHRDQFGDVEVEEPLVTKLRFEAWTLPTSADFKPLFDRPLPAVDGTGVVELSDYTDGTVTVPASWEGLKTWNGGWIRVYLGDVLIDEFLAERAPVDLQRPGTVTFSGPSVNGLVEKCAVYPYNYPNDAPGAQDWHWGLDENMLRNGDADENPLGLENPGFEDGVRA